MYQGKNIGTPVFKLHGHIYGPLRLQIDKASPVYKKLLKHVANIDFVKDKKSIFLVRDPRDILVSGFYSSGYSHGISDSLNTKQRQISKREKIQATNLDDYVLEVAHKTLGKFELAIELINATDRSLLLRYEDMIINFDEFKSQLTSYISLNDEVVDTIYRRTRPRKEENIASHQRSGRPEGFRDKLKDETINYLNQQFETILKQLNYEI